jgi:uncharacterized protein YcaQ
MSAFYDSCRDRILGLFDFSYKISVDISDYTERRQRQYKRYYI